MPAPSFASVYFDCDSTLSAIEGVDELLGFADPALRREIADLTTKAMNGDLPLAAVYETRLAKLAPRREQLELVGRRYVERLVPDAREVIAALRWLGKHVGIVSGGLLVPVLHVARELGIRAEDVYAVPLFFAADGSYAGFDHASPLWRNLGKIEVLDGLPDDHRPIAFVGDGVTDLETRPHVARFVGFGGVEVRAKVRAGADYFVATPSLAGVLPFVLTPAELDRLRASPQHSPLLSAAEA